MSNSKFDTEYMTEPICPHCKVPQENTWEYDFEESDTFEHNCELCGEPILIIRHISIAYSTYPIS